MKTKFILKAVVFFCILSFITTIPADSKPDKTMPEPPSGTKPAEPAVPGEKPAEPAVPGDKTDKVKPEHPDKPEKDIKDNGKQETPDKDKTAKEDIKDEKKPDDKQKSDEDSKKKDKKDKSKKDKPKKGFKLSPSVSSPPSPHGAAAAAGGGILGGILGIFKGSGDKKEKQTKSSQTISGTELPVKSSMTETGVTVSTAMPAAKIATTDLFSDGRGPKIAVFDFEGESGKEFADALSEELSAKGFKVYNRNVIKEKGLAELKVNRATINKISKEIECDYLVNGRINAKTETLFIISVFLKHGKNADIKMTHFVNIKSMSEIRKGAKQASEKIKNAAK